MNKAKILHNIRKMLEEKGIKEVRSAGMKKDLMALYILDQDDKEFIITVQEVAKEV
jgi:hypothetical protein